MSNSVAESKSDKAENLPQDAPPVAQQALPTLSEELKLTDDPEEFLTNQGFDQLEPSDMNKLFVSIRALLKYRQAEVDAACAVVERGPGASPKTTLQELLLKARNPFKWVPSYVYDPVTAIRDCAMRHSLAGCRWEKGMGRNTIDHLRVPQILMYRLDTAHVRVCGDCFLGSEGKLDLLAVSHALAQGPDRRRLPKNGTKLTTAECVALVAEYQEASPSKKARHE